MSNPVSAIVSTFGDLVQSLGGAVRHALPHGKPEPQVSPVERDVLAAIGKAYDSTWHAFDPNLENEADFDARDARAKADAEALTRLFAERRDELPDEIRPRVSALVERVEAAQLQLMAFAINRKNRGTPDEAQIEAELKDRRAFREACAQTIAELPDELREQLQGA